MADSKKLTRAEVFRQIDNFRGIARSGAPGKRSIEAWLDAKCADAKSPSVPAGNGKVMNHGLIRIRVH